MREARNRGQVAKSRDLTAVSVLLSGGLAIYASSSFMLTHFRRILENVWTHDAFTTPGYLEVPGFSANIILSLCAMLSPVVLTILAAAVILNLTQIKGFLFSFEALRISLSNLSPAKGFRRIFSLRSLMELIKSALKLAVISYALYSVLWPERSSLFDLAQLDVGDAMRYIGILCLKVLIRVAAIMLIISLLDFLYQKWQNRKDLMMTRQETKEEHKQSEGNPQIKSRIRSIQRALARQRMLTKIPKASVIITNPTHYAVALLYKPGMEAPTLAAKGMNTLAQRIISLGRKHSVPIVQNPPLARALYKQVKLDETIPVELYRAVAKILAYIYQQKQSMRRNQNG